MMSLNGLLSTVGLARPSGRRGFCPACRLLLVGDPPHASSELAMPAVAIAATLVVAGGAWAFTVDQTNAMSGMAMGLGSLDSFAITWIVMMAAMMLPSAIPLIFEFARRSEGRRAWPVATAVLALTYLAVWLAFGLACYGVYVAIGMPWPNQSLVGGGALALGGLYALTPIKRASQARCRELCALHGPLPFNLPRSAGIAGVRYALSCVGCSAGLMIAMVLIGMSNLLVAVMLAAAVLVYKLAPPLAWRDEMVLSLGLAAAGVAYAVLA
jgi:predicted metal-binding membrane protein